MFNDSFEEKIKNQFYRSYENFLPSSSIISQDVSQSDFQLFFTENENSIFKNFNDFNDHDIFNNLDLKEKAIGDKTIFKTNLKEEMPILYSFEDIKKIFKKAIYIKKLSSKVNKKFIKDKETEAVYLNKKRIRDYTDDEYINGFLENENNQNYELPNKKKRGRIPKVEGREEHNRMTSDNIIKKIKAEIFKYLTQFLNNIIKGKKTIGENNKIYRINYCFINQLNREIDLRYLNMPLKNLFSLLDISPKYKNIHPESNKIYIKNLLNGQTDKAIKFAFNITLRDWLDIFLFKKEVKDVLDEYNVKDNKNIICKEIKESLVGVDDLLNNLVEKEENKKYFSNFIFYFYNYELWFFKKKGRKSRSNNYKIKYEDNLIY